MEIRNRNERIRNTNCPYAYLRDVWDHMYQKIGITISQKNLISKQKHGNKFRQGCDTRLFLFPSNLPFLLKIVDRK